MFAVYTTYAPSGNKVLNILSKTVSLTDSDDIKRVIAKAALATAQLSIVKEQSAVDYNVFLHSLINGEHTTRGDTDFTHTIGRRVNFDNNTAIIPYPEDVTEDNINPVSQLIVTLFNNIAIFCSMLNTIDTADSFIVLKGLADKYHISTNGARGASSVDTAIIRKEIEYAVADSFANTPNISSIIAGKLNTKYMDEYGNELRLVVGSGENVTEGLDKVVNHLRTSLTHTQFAANLNLIQSDITRIVRNINRTNDQALSMKYNEGYSAAIKQFTSISRDGNWHVEMSDNLPFTSEMGKPYAIYHGPMIKCNSLFRDGEMYNFPQELVGPYYITAIAIPIKDVLCNCMALGWHPHRSSNSDDDTPESEEGRWGSLCIGDLDCKEFERFVDIPSMLETVYWHSMYPGNAALAGEVLFGFLEYNEGEGDYYNTKDCEFYSKDLIEGTLSAFHEYAGKIKEFVIQEMFTVDLSGRNRN